MKANTAPLWIGILLLGGCARPDVDVEVVHLDPVLEIFIDQLQQPLPPQKPAEPADDAGQDADAEPAPKEEPAPDKPDEAPKDAEPPQDSDQPAKQPADDPARDDAEKDANEPADQPPSDRQTTRTSSPALPATGTELFAHADDPDPPAASDEPQPDPDKDSPDKPTEDNKDTPDKAGPDDAKPDEPKPDEPAAEEKPPADEPAEPAGAESIFLAPQGGIQPLAADEERPALMDAFLESFATALNAAELIDTPIGVHLLADGSIEGFLDPDQDMRKRSSLEAHLFRIQVDADGERNRLIASDDVGHHSRAAPYPDPEEGQFSSLVLGTMLGRQIRFYDTGLREKPDFGEIKLDRSNYYPDALREAQDRESPP